MRTASGRGSGHAHLVLAPVDVEAEPAEGGLDRRDRAGEPGGERGGGVGAPAPRPRPATIAVRRRRPSVRRRPRAVGRRAVNESDGMREHGDVGVGVDRQRGSRRRPRGHGPPRPPPGRPRARCAPRHVVVDRAQSASTAAAVRCAQNPRGGPSGETLLSGHGAAQGSEAARGHDRGAAGGGVPRDRRSSCARCGTTRRSSCSRATILSAQCTDEMVNSVTPALFARYPDPDALAARGPRRGRGDRPRDRVLPAEDEEPHRHGHRGPRPLRRRGADRARRPRDAARRRPQDRQRAALGRVRPARASRSTRTSAGSRPGSSSPTETDPVKVELDLNALVAAGGAGRVLAAADPARPAGLRRPQAAVRRVPARRHLPVGGQAVSAPFDIRPVEGDDFEQYFDVRVAVVRRAARPTATTGWTSSRRRPTS